MLRLIGKIFYGVDIKNNSDSENLIIEESIIKEKQFYAQLESSRVSPKWGINNIISEHFN